MKNAVLANYTGAKCIKMQYRNSDGKGEWYTSFEIHVPSGEVFPLRSDGSISIIGRGRTAKSAWIRAYQFMSRRIIEKLEK